MRKVADTKEIHAFWTTVMRSEEASATERFKASELLAKSQGEEADELDLRWYKDEE